jgi:hypothetical protein
MERGRLFRRDDLAGGQHLDGADPAGLAAGEEARAAGGEEGVAPARLGFADDECAEMVERRLDAAVLVDDEERQVERAAPGLPVGGDVLGLVGDDEGDGELRITRMPPWASVAVMRTATPV